MLRKKIYGVCLDRVNELIAKAKERRNGNRLHGRVVLESYCTEDIDEIVFVLDLYDLEERTQMGLRKELEYLASAISDLTRETLTFGYTEEGHLGLYLTVSDGVTHTREVVAAYG